MKAPQSVWVIEDDPVQSALCERILQAAGYQVSTTGEPAALLRGIHETPAPSAMVVDLGLPEIDGLTLLQRLLSHPQWCKVPTVIMTATPEEDRVLAAQRLAVPPEGFLVKPFKSHELLSILKAVLTAAEPHYHLRRLQRSRLGAQMHLAEIVREVEATMKGTGESREEIENQMASARRQIQSLKTAGSQLRGAPAETREAIQRKIQELETSLSAGRSLIQGIETRQKEIGARRQKIVVCQRFIRDLEGQIQAVAQVLKRGAASTGMRRA